MHGLFPEGAGQGGQEFRSTRPKPVAGLRYSVETCAQFIDWEEVLLVPRPAGETPTTETRAGPLPAGEARFARLRIHLLE